MNPGRAGAESERLPSHETVFAMPAHRDEELDTPHPLTDAQVRSLRENGHVTLPGVFSEQLLAFYESEITTLVEKNNRNTLPMEERGSYAQAFVQVTNLWKRSDVARRFSLNRRCAQIAAQLLGCSGVRLWHDQALYKEPGGGITPWHCDQFFWPMANERSLTAWIPLQATPVEMGPLYYADRSHIHDYGRHLGISDAGEERISAGIERAGLHFEQRPFELGDVSFHYGWTMHRAAANRTTEMRRAMTMIYMDEEMRLAPAENPFQENDRKAWCPGVEVGDVIDSPLNPVVYSTRG